MKMTSPLRVLADLPHLLRHPHSSRQQIREYQEKRLRRLIHHAYARVPYYRRLFDDAGLAPSEIRTLDDLHLIPITTKATLQALGDSDLISEGLDPSRLIVRQTNGSTGVPLSVRRQWAEQVTITLFQWRLRSELGLNRGQRVAWFYNGWWHRRSSSRIARAKRRAQRMAGIAEWTRIFFHEPIEELVRQLRECNPDVIGGYAGVLARVASHLGAEQTEIRPRLVLSTAEVLTPEMRQRVESTFGAPVRDTYSSYELGTIAWECAGGGTYHVCDDNVIVEVLNHGSPVGHGESGELVGTSLHFAAMPVIRYQQGDLVTRGPDRCACGSEFTTLSEIQGRVTDYFSLPDGRRLHPYALGAAVRAASYRWMLQYQIVQERLDRVVMRVVPSLHAEDADVDEARRLIGSVLGPDVEVVVELADEIPADIGGKFKIYRSLVSPPGDLPADAGAELQVRGAR